MKKKVVSMMMAASLVTGMLTGCGSSAAPVQTTDNGTQADASTTQQREQQRQRLLHCRK